MRIQPTGATLLLSTLLPSLGAALGFDCAHINIDKYKYDFSALGGVHEVSHVVETEDLITNTTYVLNICKILKGAANRGDAKCGTSKNSAFPSLVPPAPYTCELGSSLLTRFSQSAASYTRPPKTETGAHPSASR